MQLDPKVDGFFDVMADPTRRRIVAMLTTRPHRAGELSRSLGTSAPAMSRHLRLLLDRGVVVDERPAEDARGRLFRLRPEPFTALVAWADQMQAQWDEQLAAFRKHVVDGEPKRRRRRS